MKRILSYVLGAVMMLAFNSFANAMIVEPASADGEKYTFSGDLMVAYSSITMKCEVSIEGYMDAASDKFYMTDHLVSGLFPCNTVTSYLSETADVIELDADGGGVVFSEFSMAIL